MSEREMLGKSIRSVLNQSYQSLELIIYDDGSSAKTSHMLKGIAELDSRIILLGSKVNRGLGYALNRCIEASNGEYVARMDADDECKPDRIGIQIQFLEQNHDYGWCGTSAVIFDDAGEWGHARRNDRPETVEFLKYSPYIHPTVVFRRDVLVEMGGYSEEHICRRCEDFELFARLHAKGYRGYNISDEVFSYRIDRNYCHHRRLRERINEMKVRYRSYKLLGFRNISIIIPTVRPVLSALIPSRAIRVIKEKTGSL